MLAALQRSGAIDQLVHEQLAMEESRPRCIPHGDGILLNLRARAADGLEEERELVAIRCWITRAGMVTAWRRPAMAAAALLEEAGRGNCPATCGDVVASLCLHVADSIEPMVDELSEKIDELELELLDMSRAARRKELAALRRKAIALRRFLYPQRDALSSFVVQHGGLLAERDRAHVHEAHEHTTRFIEELEGTRERTTVIYDEMVDLRAEQMNRQILLLSVVSAVFLPTSLFAGMLGMNVQGIPYADSPWAFAAICAAMLAIVLFELVLFRWLKII